MSASLAVLFASGACAGVGCVADTSEPVPPGIDAGGFDRFVPEPIIDATPPPTRDVNVPDASHPADAGSDTNVADTSVPDTSVPNTNVPDTNVGDANAADTNVPDTNIPDTNVPDTSVPDAGPVFTHFLFEQVTTSNSVAAWGVSTATGALTAINQTPEAGATYAVPTGTNPLASCVVGSALYTANAAGSVSGYAIAHGGLLTRMDADPGTAGIQDFPAGATARFIAGANGFLFTANEGGPSVSRFSIGAGGFLTPLGDVVLATGSDPNGLVVDPLGKFVFVFNYGLKTISAYAVDAKGTLTIVDQDAKTAGQQDYSIPTGAFIGTPHPTLPVIYVAAAAGSALMTALSYDVNGVLTADGTAQPAGQNTYGLAVDPAGTFLYSVGYGDSLVRSYALDAKTGAPTAATTVTSTTELRSVSVDPGGKFLYVGGDFNQITPFAITAGTGALTATGAQFAGSNGAYTMPMTIIP